MAAPLYNRRRRNQSVGFSRAPNRGMASPSYSRAPKGTPGAPDQLSPLRVAKLTHRLVKTKEAFRANPDLPNSGISASGGLAGAPKSFHNPYLVRIKALRGRLAGQRPPGQKLEGPPQINGRGRRIDPGFYKPGPSQPPVMPGRRGRGRGQFGGNFNATVGYGRKRRNSRFRPPLS